MQPLLCGHPQADDVARSGAALEGMRYIDLFCGIGGFHAAGQALGMQCVFASDIDTAAAKAYEENWGIRPRGDITKIDPSDIPVHDVLFAGFPCQPFSAAGSRRGFDDTRGTLFFEVAAILQNHRTPAFVLENVAQLVTHDEGRTLARILEIIRALGYKADWRVLNALDFGLPHKRSRIFIRGVLEDGVFAQGPWPTGGLPMRPLSEILEPHHLVESKHFVNELIAARMARGHVAAVSPSIWHRNKSGSIASHPFSCTMRAKGSHNYLLVDGIRRPTPRETLRLQGFPESFRIVCNDTQTRKQTGNSVAIPVVRAVVESLIRVKPSDRLALAA